MSEQTPGGHSLYSLLPTEIDGVNSLAELALDLHWSWNHGLAACLAGPGRLSQALPLGQQ